MLSSACMQFCSWARTHVLRSHITVTTALLFFTLFGGPEKENDFKERNENVCTQVLALPDSGKNLVHLDRTPLDWGLLLQWSSSKN